MKSVDMWHDPAFLRHAIPPEEDRPRIHPSTVMAPRWFRSPNVIPIERHERFVGFGVTKGKLSIAEREITK
jgi:hypothetical protein